MKNLAVLFMILGIACASQAVMIADFEDGLDGFVAGVNTTISQSTTAGTVTSGTYSLQIQQSAVSYWGVHWVAPSVPERLGKLQFDLTMIASEWPNQNWTRFAQKLSLQIDGGWAETPETTTDNWVYRDTGETAPVDWGAWDGDTARTCTIDLSGYDVTGATSFIINFSTGIGTEGGPYGAFYIDNVHFVDEPHNPNPPDGSIVGLAATQANGLSWDNATDSLDSVTVWFGIPPEPNEADPNSILGPATYKNLLSPIYSEVNPGASSSCPVPTLTEATYTWCVVSEPNELYPTFSFWTFTTSINAPPVAVAGPDQYEWLGHNSTDPNSVVITLDASASTDDGLITEKTYTWSQIAGPANGAIFDDIHGETTSVTLTGGLANTTETGASAPYEFQVDVYDGQHTSSDTLTVYVNSTSCTASNEYATQNPSEPEGFFRFGDIAGPDGSGDAYRDCKVDLYDFAELAVNWLNCSNIFESCD